MDDHSKRAAHELLGDPLSSATRGSKRALYVFCSLCVLVAYTGIVPQEVSLVGFRFPGFTRELAVCGLFVALTYNLIVYFLYATSDYLRLRILMDRFARAQAVEMSNSIKPSHEVEEEEYWDAEFRRETGYVEKDIPSFAPRAIAVAKLLFDFALPTVFGVLSLLYFYVSQIL